jgi:mRNA interferase HigB
MRIITRTRIKKGIEEYPQWSLGLNLWIAIFKDKNLDFESFQQVREVWKNASGWNTDRVPSRKILENNFSGDFDVYIFDIHGTDCRLVTRINAESNTVFIRKVASHAEYDKWCKAKVK